MLAVVILSALLGLALGDPLPPIKKHTQIIHVPAPKPQVVRVPALQEHAVRQVQHVPIRQTVVRHVNVPKNIIREEEIVWSTGDAYSSWAPDTTSGVSRVPVIVEKQLILRQPQIRKFPIDVKKTILQPYVKPVPQVRVNYRKRPYDVWHTRVQKKYINVPRPVPVIKHKIVTKVLNRIVDVPHKVYKDKVKVVRVPQPFKVQKVHQRKIDVPVVVQVPVPRVRVKQTQEIQNVPIDVTVVRKVGIPKKTTLTEIVPVPVKPEGCGPDGVACGSFASASSVTSSAVGVVDGGLERRGLVIEEGRGPVSVHSTVSHVGPAVDSVTEIHRSVRPGGLVRGAVDIERGLYGPDVPGYAPGIGVRGGVGESAFFDEFSIPPPEIPGPSPPFTDGPGGDGFVLPINENVPFSEGPGGPFSEGFGGGSVDGSVGVGSAIYDSGFSSSHSDAFGGAMIRESGIELGQDHIGGRLYEEGGSAGGGAEIINGGLDVSGGSRSGVIYEERRSLPLYVGGRVKGRYIQTDGGGYPQKFDDSDGGAAGHLGAGLNQAAYFGSIDAPYSDNSFFGGEFAGAQAQAQAHVLAQAQNYAHAQANINGDSLHNDLELANQLAYSDNYGDKHFDDRKYPIARI